MPRLFVVNNPKNWPLKIPGVDVVSSRDYLTDPQYNDIARAKVFNLCRSYRYMSNGYYVSLLAEARGHRPIPSILTLQDVKTDAVVRVASQDLDDLIQKNLGTLKAKTFELSIYFGRNMANRYSILSQEIFNLFGAPLLRAYFERDKEGWYFDSIALIGGNDVPDKHRPFVIQAAQEYFRKGTGKRRRQRFRYDLAILHNPEDPDPPSNPKALRKFVRAAEAIGLSAELITRNDYRRLPEYDALFIRETTQVNHHTYRFARRAAAEGLVVIDDPESIIRCTNKVYLAELFDQHKLPAPKTMIVHADNTDAIEETLNLPCILKLPDSSFSQGVVKAETREALQTHVHKMLVESDLLIAQEFMPTEFDWRVGVLDNRPLFVCKYFMAHRHWQILKKDKKGHLRGGKVEAVAVELAPENVLRVAIAATKLIGNGFYGVDVKEIDGRVYLIEVNDNPSVESGYEDILVKDDLYHAVMRTFLRRIERLKEA